MSVVTNTGISLHEAAEFIWREADLLDDLAYGDWLQLWTAEGLYIVPIDRDVEDHAAALNLLYDDQAMREARVKRLLSGFSMSSAPPARTVRTVSRFRVMEREEDALTLRAAQQLVEYKYERTRVLAADVTFRIVRAGDDLALDRKVVRLVNSDDALFGIGYLL